MEAGIEFKEVQDQLTGTEDLEETKTIPFEDVMLDRKTLEEYGTIISEELLMKKEHIELQGKAHTLSFEADQDEVKESQNETKAFKQVSPTKAEIEEQLLKTSELEKVQAKSLENIILQRDAFRENGTCMSRELVIDEEEPAVSQKKEYNVFAGDMSLAKQKDQLYVTEDLDEIKTGKFKDIFQQECGILLKKLTEKEEFMVLDENKHKTFSEQKYSAPQTEEKHILLKEKKSIITPLNVYEKTASEEDISILEKEIKGYHSEVEEERIVRKDAIMEVDKQDGFGFAGQVIKEQIVEDSLTDISDSGSYGQTEFFAEFSNNIDGTKEDAKNEAFLCPPEIQSEIENRQLTAELPSAKAKEECKDRKPFLRDELISSEVSFTDLVVGHPAHGKDDMTGTKAKQWRTEDKDLQKMGKSISNLTEKGLQTKEEEAMRVSRKEITPQQTQESLNEIQDDMEKLLEHQLEENITCTGVIPTVGTQKVEEWNLSRSDSVAASEQSTSLSPKKKFKKERKMEVSQEPSLFLDQIQEYSNIITDVEHNKTNSDAKARKLSVKEDPLKDQQWTEIRDDRFADQSQKPLKLSKETATVAREIILAPADLTDLGISKVSDYIVKNDLGETSIEQLPDIGYLQFTSPAATEKCVEAALMQETVAEELNLKKGTDYIPTKDLNEPKQKDEEEVDSKETTIPFVVETYQKSLIKLGESESEMSTPNAQDKLYYTALNSPSPADQSALFISADEQMNISLPGNLYNVSENSCKDRVLAENLSESMQTEILFKEDLQKEVPENYENQPMITSTSDIGLVENKGISFDKLISEEGTSYEDNLDGTSHLLTGRKIDEKVKPFSTEAKHPHELTVDISWTPEEKEGTDEKTGLEKQKFSDAEQLIMYPSKDTINIIIKEERATENVTKESEKSNIDPGSDGDESYSEFKSAKWEKPTDGSEMTSEKLKTNKLMRESAAKIEKLIEHDKEFEERFTTKVSEVDKEEPESFSTYRFKLGKNKTERNISMESLTPQKWLKSGKENQDELAIQGQQMSELARSEKLEENVDILSSEMMNRDQKGSEKGVTAIDGDLELTKEAQTLWNDELETNEISGDITIPQQSFSVSASDDKKSLPVKEGFPKNLTAKHDLLTSFEEENLEGDVHNRMTTSSSCKSSMEKQRKILVSDQGKEAEKHVASETFLDGDGIFPAVPQQSEDTHVLEKGSDEHKLSQRSIGEESFKEDFFAPAKAMESGAAAVFANSEALAASRSIEIIPMVEDQKSFLRSSSFDASNNSMEKIKEDKKMSRHGYKESSEKLIISSAEAFAEPSDPKVIYNEVNDVLWKQIEGNESEETVSGKQLQLTVKEGRAVEVETEQNVTLSNVSDKYIYEKKFPAEQKECHEFTLSKKEEAEEDASTSFLPTCVEDTQTESLKEVGRRIESPEGAAVVAQQWAEEEIINNKFSHPAKEKYRETKKDVFEMESIRDDDMKWKVEAMPESTSEVVFSEELLTLIEAPSSRQKIDKGSSEMDEETKIARGTDLEANAEHLIDENLGKLDQTTSRSSSSYNLDSLIGKHSDSKSPPSEVKPTIGKCVSHVQDEYEADYESDLKEKIKMLGEEAKKSKHPEGRSLLNEDERNEELNKQAAEIVDDIMKPVESLSRSESIYKTATATSKNGYETCLTSQEDTFDTAPGYHSQESEYTTANSEASSRFSEISEERRENATPIAMLSPVQSDRLFTASQDEEQELNRQENVLDSKRSSPDITDIELVSVEDDDDMEDILLTSASGVLLVPDVDPGRPVSPTPPGFGDEDENIIGVATASDCSRKTIDQVRQVEIKVLDSIVEAPGDDILADETFSSWERDVPEPTIFQESMHEKAMNFEKEYFLDYSNLSGRTVHTVEKEDEAAGVTLASETVICTESDSLDSLDKISIKSGSSGKKFSTSRRSSTSSRKSSHDEPQTFVERLTPELKMSWVEKDQEVGLTKQSSLSSSEEYPTYMSESEQINPVEAELETVDEEPEEADSLNGRSMSSNGQGTDISVTVGKYKTVSSDNVSETSLQEFERIERDVLNKGESSLSGSEVELYVAGKLKKADGSTSSLAEFERLEQEVVVEGSPQDEVMILSDIREESEVEEMSIRDDDEEEHDSISDIKAIPVEEDTTQVTTPMASPADSIERDFENFVPEIMGTSIDSLEINVVPVHTENELSGESYLTEYEVIEKVHEELHDSLEIIPQEKDSMLEGVSVVELTNQDKQALLSGDTMSTYQGDQEDEKDSLAGDLKTLLHDYPTTLTTFETMQINEDGTAEIISRRVLTRVTDPIISHVQFTGTENEHRLRDLEREEEFETMDIEGNVTRTTLHRSAPSSSAGTSHSTHRG
ncbi:unnamed protein product [Onchocerca ochengi]|uniref:Ankyrin-2 n=1 Tax=Onchocerca ochengi TaxID=42157 RepID=A0A182E9L2_ONCOC|nr:unnamed protein product [Onchocerca ochengi]